MPYQKLNKSFKLVFFKKKKSSKTPYLEKIKTKQLQTIKTGKGSMTSTLEEKKQKSLVNSKPPQYSKNLRIKPLT
jgi:hypothetical protein